MVQWLGLDAFSAGAMGLIPSRGTKIPQVVGCGQKKEERQCLAHTSTSGLVAAIITATIISAIMVMMIFLKDLFIYSFLVT